MFEFQKLCNEIEALSPAERAVLLGEKAIAVVAGLRALGASGEDRIGVLASFIVGSAVSDGKISEKDYMLIAPSLEKALGGECDVAEIETYYKVSRDAQKLIKTFTTELMAILAEADEKLANDIVSLCLLVTAVDGKITQKEKRYVKQLCKA